MEKITQAFVQLFNLDVDLWVLAILLLMAFIVLALKFEYKWTWSVVARILSVEYLLYVLLATVIMREPTAERIIGATLMEKYHMAFVQLDPEALYDTVMNVLLFLPLGFLVNFWFKDYVVVRSLLTCLVISCVIELLQYVFKLGYFETADIVHNTIGGGVGCLMCGMLRRFCKLRK